MNGKPSVCFYDKDISKYLDKGVESLSVGDTFTVSFKVRVTEVSQEER
jgi:hypothetical protein